MWPALIRLLGIAAFAAVGTSTAAAQSQELKDLRTTLELVFMCSVRNDTTPDVRAYFEATGDATLQREWNRAMDRARRQMQVAQKNGGQAAVRALQRYDLSCTLLDAASDLPIGLQSALHR